MAIDFVRDLCPAFHPAALWLTKLAPTALEAPGINALDLLRTRAIPSTASAKQGRATAALDPLEPWWSAREAAAAEAEMGEGPAKPSRGVQGAWRGVMRHAGRGIVGVGGHGYHGARW